MDACQLPSVTMLVRSCVPSKEHWRVSCRPCVLTESYPSFRGCFGHLGGWAGVASDGHFYKTRDIDFVFRDDDDSSVQPFLGPAGPTFHSTVQRSACESPFHISWNGLEWCAPDRTELVVISDPKALDGGKQGRFGIEGLVVVGRLQVKMARGKERNLGQGENGWYCKHDSVGE
ncbi:hypothetical protein LZ30DRAFT_188758 [Colletotrichum cereale]|nr:hypothetical protein LZ30DRAFT_188758 [Colletotrichum cereale]